MSDNTPKKRGRPAKRRQKTSSQPDRPVITTKRKTKKEREIEEMAAQVFKAQQEQEGLIEEVNAETSKSTPIPNAETPKTKSKPIPNAVTLQQPEENDNPIPATFTQGLTRPTAFVIQKHALREIDAILGKHLGRADYDYFVHSENTMTLPRNGRQLKYKCVLVEDKHGYRYNIWFDLSNVGPFGY
jgi:hypothetical protein